MRRQPIPVYPRAARSAEILDVDVPPHMNEEVLARRPRIFEADVCVRCPADPDYAA